MKPVAPANFVCEHQTFSELGGPDHGKERIARLRAQLEAMDLAGFIVPRADEHQNEYVAPSSERLLWLTGFSGSAGLAIVLRRKAALFVDGRYTVQVRSQIDLSVIEPQHLIEAPPAEWLEKNLEPGDRVGFDPWLHTVDAVERFSKACARAGASLVPVARNPVDAIWSDRPAEPVAAVALHGPKLAGEVSTKKLAALRSKLGDADGLVVSDAHNVAWLFNIRGGDVAHTPLPLCFAYVPKTGKPTLFIDGRKLSNSIRATLMKVCEVEEPGRLRAHMETLGQQRARVVVDAATGPYALSDALQKAGGAARVEPDPIALMKAKKNPAELAGTVAAHIRDGAAMTRFLAWFDEEAPKGKLTEISAAQALETFRRETGALKDVSFPSISAAGPHAAIPHYRVSEESNLNIGKGLYLIDSGGQYLDGTTDITRTISVGAPSRLMIDRFTRVLKGHIAIATVMFPKGVSGAQIDVLARQSLWQAGLDFDHGTGHGIGSYLSVHEGPQRIAKTGTVPLEPGMILSNEPGYYAAGQFGIRIENLIVVEPRSVKGGEREMLAFKTISLAPIDTRLVDPDMLDPAEKAWLNAYHAGVRTTLSPLVDRATKLWLAKATRKI